MIVTFKIVKFKHLDWPFQKLMQAPSGNLYFGKLRTIRLNDSPRVGGGGGGVEKSNVIL